MKTLSIKEDVENENIEIYYICDKTRNKTKDDAYS